MPRGIFERHPRSVTRPIPEPGRCYRNGAGQVRRLLEVVDGLALYQVETPGPCLHAAARRNRPTAGDTGAVRLDSFRTWLVCECTPDGERVPTGLRAPKPRTAHILEALRVAVVEENKKTTLALALV